LDVDAQRGALLEREQGVAAIRARARQIAAALPAYPRSPAWSGWSARMRVSVAAFKRLHSAAGRVI